MSDATRQHYKLATGAGLNDAPAKTAQPGYAKGGSVKKGPTPKGGSSKKACR